MMIDPYDQIGWTLAKLMTLWQTGEKRFVAVADLIGFLTAFPQGKRALVIDNETTSFGPFRDLMPSPTLLVLGEFASWSAERVKALTAAIAATPNWSPMVLGLVKPKDVILIGTDETDADVVLGRWSTLERNARLLGAAIVSPIHGEVMR